MLEQTSRDHGASEQRYDSVTKRESVFSCQQGDAPLREHKPVPLELIQRVEHDLHLLGHRIHNKFMVLPFESGGGKAEDAKVRRESTPLRNRLRPDAAMRRCQAQHCGGVAVQPARTLKRHNVGGVSDEFRAAQRR
jgi:hypothetical protein